jgi:hypothetical protein
MRKNTYRIQNKKDNSDTAGFFYILFLALSIRMIVPLFVLLTTRDYTLFYAPDTFSYIRPAQELLFHGRFYANGAPELFRTPGYPALLIPGIFLGNVELVTIAIQIVLGCLTTYLVFRISLLLFKNIKAALFSAFLFAIEPVSIIYASKLLSETLFTFLNTLFLFFMARYLEHAQLRKIIFASAVLSATVYVKPINYFLPFLATLILIIWALNQRGFRTRFIAHSFLFLFSSVVLLGIWQVRNFVTIGYSGFSTVSDVSLYCYQGASLLAVEAGVPFNEMHQKMGCTDGSIYLQKHPEQQDWDQKKTYEYMRREGFRIIMAHPVDYTITYVKGIVRTLIDPGSTEYLIFFKLYPKAGALLSEILDKGFIKVIQNVINTKSLVFIGSIVIFGIFLLVSLICAAISLCDKEFSYSFLTVFILFIMGYSLLLSGGPVGYHRFRLPVMPLISVFSGYGLYLVCQRYRQKESG